MTDRRSARPDHVDVGDLEQLAINVIRGIAIDAPRAANSGHPGTAMALAPLAHVLFTRVLRHSPTEPGWPDRDRFVLSNGHASILLYTMLYLTGYGLELDDLRAFRSWGSRTPGHPERKHAPGIEVTTGPLGQGFANSAGMAIAERWLRANFSPEVCDHHTFVFAGDGCFEEGISHEAGSLAGHLGLGRLICVYDDNHITIDGPTELAYTDDVAERFTAYGWAVEDVGEIANDTAALEAALRRAEDEEERPSLIILRSHIGYPAPHIMDTAKAHGDPLSDDEARLTKEILGLPTDETFWVPAEVLELYRRCIPRGPGDGSRMAGSVRGVGRRQGPVGRRPERPRSSRMGAEAAHLRSRRRAHGHPQGHQGMSRRHRAAHPRRHAGAADLTGNTGMALAGAVAQSHEHPEGSLIHYGIREHGMGGIMNGMAAHGGVLPVGGTFFVFSDYMRGAVRVGTLSYEHVIYSWTHDSVGLGQDGPTHQPIEHLAALRAMPQLRLIRPADANETAAAWRIAVEHDGPTALVLTRQDVPVLDATADLAPEGVSRGAYVLRRPGGRPSSTSCSSERAVRSACAWTRPRSSPAGEPELGSCPSPRGTCSPSSPTTIGATSFHRASPVSPSKRPAPSAGSDTPTPPCPSTDSGLRLRVRRSSTSSASTPITWRRRPSIY